ncbi:MAG: membrane protein insertase YidC [Candidatus Eisenbacteria bacterium]
MEKRALIAVVMMFMVLIIYNVFLTPKRKPPTEPPAGSPETADAEQVPGRVVDEPAAGAESLEISLPADTAPAREVEVTTPLYTARFSSTGGVLTSFRLNGYLSSTEEPVELVPQAGRLPLGVALLTGTGERIDLSQTPFAVSADYLDVATGHEASLVFSLETEDGLRVGKTCTFNGDTYAIDVEIGVSGAGSEGMRAVEFGWQSGLMSTEANHKDDLGNFAAITLADDKVVKNSLANFKKRDEIAVGGNVTWTGVKTKYFLAGLVPLDATGVLARGFASSEEAIGVVVEVDMPASAAQRFVVYVGPLDYEGLKKLDLGLDRAVDFGWKWIRPLSRLIFAFMLLCHRAIPNYGVVIIILSALTKLLFWPLTQKSFKSMREMQRIQPEMAAMKEKYKNEPQRLNKAMMGLYKERGVNPVGGCLPLLLQMPVFISLFNVLRLTIELRRAPFVLWINDLSAPDVLARLPFSLPFIGNALSLLPILMGIAMFLQQKMSATDPKQAAMTYMLPIVFTVMFFRFPSGLVLYWLVNNVLTIAHQYLMARGERTQQVATTGG